MPAPAGVIYLTERLAPYAIRSLRTLSRGSRALRLPPFINRLPPAYQGSAYLAGQGLYRGRQRWNRATIPLYGLQPNIIRAVPVAVPSGLSFVWENYSELPEFMPEVTFRPPRNTGKYEELGLPFPEYEFAYRKTPARGYGAGPKRPEPNRPRHDAKVDYGLMRYYRFFHRTFGSYTEYVEFADAFENNFHLGPMAVATALAMNEYIDFTYGKGATTLRDQVYRDPALWRLPVGFQTLSRLWR